MSRTPSGMPSELLDPREVAQRFKEVDLASARAKTKVMVQLAQAKSVIGLVRLFDRAQAQ